MKNLLGILTFALALQTVCLAQTKEVKPSKIFLSAGYGAAGNFFVRDYDEKLPFPSAYYKAFFTKQFVGTAQEIAVGIHLKKNIDIKFGYNRQRFTRHVLLDDTLPSGVAVYLDHKIQHVDNNWFVGMSKNYIRKKSQLSWGTGLFYLISQKQTVEVTSRYIIDKEFNGKNTRLNELGAFAELAYEYKFQPKVNLGIKSQFGWVVSGSYPEFVTLSPFIKLNF